MLTALLMFNIGVEIGQILRGVVLGIGATVKSRSNNFHKPGSMGMDAHLPD